MLGKRLISKTFKNLFNPKLLMYFCVSLSLIPSYFKEFIVLSWCMFKNTVALFVLYCKSVSVTVWSNSLSLFQTKERGSTRVHSLNNVNRVLQVLNQNSVSLCFYLPVCPSAGRLSGLRLRARIIFIFFLVSADRRGLRNVLQGQSN